MLEAYKLPVCENCMLEAYTSPVCELELLRAYTYMYLLTVSV